MSRGTCPPQASLVDARFVVDELVQHVVARLRG
jgi:hypothetical protein